MQNSTLSDALSKVFHVSLWFIRLRAEIEFDACKTSTSCAKNYTSILLGLLPSGGVQEKAAQLLMRRKEKL